MGYVEEERVGVNATSQVEFFFHDFDKPSRPVLRFASSANFHLKEFIIAVVERIARFAKCKRGLPLPAPLHQLMRTFVFGTGYEFERSKLSKNISSKQERTPAGFAGVLWFPVMVVKPIAKWHARELDFAQRGRL